MATCPLTVQQACNILHISEDQMSMLPEHQREDLRSYKTTSDLPPYNPSAFNVVVQLMYVAKCNSSSEPSTRALLDRAFCVLTRTTFSPKECLNYYFTQEGEDTCLSSWDGKTPLTRDQHRLLEERFFTLYGQAKKNGPMATALQLHFVWIAKKPPRMPLAEACKLKLPRMSLAEACKLLNIRDFDLERIYPTERQILLSAATSLPQLSDEQRAIVLDVTSRCYVGSYSFWQSKNNRESHPNQLALLDRAFCLLTGTKLSPKECLERFFTQEGEDDTCLSSWDGKTPLTREQNRLLEDRFFALYDQVESDTLKANALKATYTWITKYLLVTNWYARLRD